MTTPTPERRYDVVYDGHGGPDIDFHFCREWEGDEGCYGTNPFHGFSFEEAKQHIIEHYNKCIEYWSSRSEVDWLQHNGYAERDDEGLSGPLA